MRKRLTQQSAIKFILLLGLVSLFADIAYEGARSISGQYLAMLGATGAVIGFVAGFGELIGYGFRFIAGYLSDKSKKYWLITFLGYGLSLIAVPMLALAGNWPLAAGLMLLERLGKAIRNPSRDAMLSYATKKTGRGWGFGLHEAMDQVGAILGPLIVAGVLYYQGSYQMSFALLLIPAICALVVLMVAWRCYPRPEALEVPNREVKMEGFSNRYWLYMAAVSCVAAGYVDFSLIAYHFEKMTVLPTVWIPLLFSIAMAADGIAALVFGRLFDAKGIVILVFVTLLSSLFAPLVFMGGLEGAILGMLLWGIGLGSQESIMRAVVATLVQTDKRATAYGTMNVCFGIAWFLGSAFMGVLYDVSVPLLVLFSVGVQLLALPLFLKVR